MTCQLLLCIVAILSEKPLTKLTKPEVVAIFINFKQEMEQIQSNISYGCLNLKNNLIGLNETFQFRKIPITCYLTLHKKIKFSMKIFNQYLQMNQKVLFAKSSESTEVTVLVIKVVTSLCEMCPNTEFFLVRIFTHPY